MGVVQQALDTLISVCDGAVTKDNVGFSKADTLMHLYDGAPEEVLEDSAIAKRLIKYHRQLGPTLTEKLRALVRQDTQGTSWDLNGPGTLFVSAGRLSLYTRNRQRAQDTYESCGVFPDDEVQEDHEDGSASMAFPPTAVLLLVAAGFNVAPRTVAWCAQQVKDLS